MSQQRMRSDNDIDRAEWSPALSTQYRVLSDAPSLSLTALRSSIHPGLARPHCKLIYAGIRKSDLAVERLGNMWRQLGFEFSWQKMVSPLTDSQKIVGVYSDADVVIWEVPGQEYDQLNPSSWDITESLRLLRLAIGDNKQIPILASSAHQNRPSAHISFDATRCEHLLHEWVAPLLPLHDETSIDTWLPTIGQAITDYNQTIHETVSQKLLNSQPKPRRILFVADDMAQGDLVKLTLQLSRQDDVVLLRPEAVPDYLQSPDAEMMITRVYLTGRYNGLELLQMATIPTLIYALGENAREQSLEMGGSFLELLCPLTQLVEARDTILETGRVFDCFNRL